MIKRTLYFGNPAYVSVRHKQLCVRKLGEDEEKTVPIEDIGMVIADHPRITFTQATVTSLQENNAVILWCGSDHLPVSMSLPFANNDTYTERIRYQLAASEPLKKQLWKQTIEAKLANQAKVLKRLGAPSPTIERMISKIGSGDPQNYEGRAAAIYWQSILTIPYSVNRGRDEGGANSLFNYGYAVLRAVLARNLVSSGCLPAMGIHHRNKYNAFCLADDIMEPYRPIVDQYIVAFLEENPEFDGNLTPDIKKYLLQIPVLDINIKGKTSPLMVGASRTSASLMDCFSGKARKILYPEL